MNSTLIESLEYLVKNINLKNINTNIINSNILVLENIFYNIKNIWDNLNISKAKYKIYIKNHNKYNKIISIITNCFLFENLKISNIINNSEKIHMISISNIYIYWLENNITSNNINYELGLKMLKISQSLNLFKYKNKDSVKRIIIWIPINKSRNFNYEKITNENLKESRNNFEAFVASGLTFGNNPRITIITRYEEIEKLLIHELIHNYYLDGSNYHEQLTNIIKKYKIIKNNSTNIINLNKIDKNYDYEFSIYESYTELLSTYFYLIFENITTQTNIRDKLFAQILLELIYSFNTISNLIKLNNYNSFEEFMSNIIFKGEICIYEYYYIKGLMYNNFELKLGKTKQDFEKIYLDIINMIKMTNNSNILLKDIYENYKKQNNFKYQIH